jgi:hypothetical protein
MSQSHNAPYQDDWDQLVVASGLTPRNLLMRTHQYGQRIVNLAEYLDCKSKHPWLHGVLEQWSQLYVFETRSLLQEVIDFTPDVNELLAHPRRHFDSGQDSQVIRGLMERFRRFINSSSPEHLKDAFAAHIYLGLGYFQGAVRRAEWALCEKSFSKSHSGRSPRMDQDAFERLRPEAQFRQAMLLIDALALFRNHQSSIKRPHVKSVASRELVPDEAVVVPNQHYASDAEAAWIEWHQRFDR